MFDVALGGMLVFGFAAGFVIGAAWKVGARSREVRYLRRRLDEYREETAFLRGRNGDLERIIRGEGEAWKLN